MGLQGTDVCCVCVICLCPQRYNTNDTDCITNLKNLLSRQDLQFIKALTKAEQEKCRTVEDVLHTL